MDSPAAQALTAAAAARKARMMAAGVDEYIADKVAAEWVQTQIAVASYAAWKQRNPGQTIHRVVGRNGLTMAEEHGL